MPVEILSMLNNSSIFSTSTASFVDRLGGLGSPLVEGILTGYVERARDQNQSSECCCVGVPLGCRSAVDSGLREESQALHCSSADGP